MGQDVVGDLQRTVRNADRLQQTASHYAERVAPGARVATIAWLGYDTPDGVQVVSAGLARRGAPPLRATLDGLRAARDAAASVDATARAVHLTVVGLPTVAS
jgi:hypothetical protein